jgi:O-6-methylguanine DNA methyltransferase
MQYKLTQFQISVYKELLKIPFGQTRTYKQVAEAIGKPKASRAVGSACAKNPWPIIIPCHRIVPSSGKMGNYSFGKGTKTKSHLIKLEGSVIE